MPSASVEEFRAILRAAKNIIVVAGAGLSAASGIPTFRGAGGIWRSLNAMELATPEAFADDPSLVWQFYHYRREKALQSQPNPAHVVLAKLAVPSILSRVAPLAQSFHLITQNVDGLSTRALKVLEYVREGKEKPDSASLLEMHGRLFDVRCESCGHTEFNTSSPLCPALGDADRQHATVVESGKKDAKVKIPLEDLPRCTQCGALTRPGVVWFGESIPLLPTIGELVDKADLCLVVGTSSTVSPAANFAYQVNQNGGKVAVFNIEPSRDDHEDSYVDFSFIGGCETELPRALGISGDVERED